jgi:hypothetical protein
MASNTTSTMTPTSHDLNGEEDYPTTPTRPQHPLGLVPKTVFGTPNDTPTANSRRQPVLNLELRGASAGLYRHDTAYRAHVSTACRLTAIYTTVYQFHQQCGPKA